MLVGACCCARSLCVCPFSAFAANTSAGPGRHSKILIAGAVSFAVKYVMIVLMISLRS